MKCGICARPIERSYYLVELNNGLSKYVLTTHTHCLEETIGNNLAARRFRHAVLDSGWIQQELPI